MEALSMLLSGFADVLQPANILFLFGGVAVGLVLGAIPGLKIGRASCRERV